jgi:ubiquinone/menaquinone biosynthesis C-methylase UbiE
MNKVATHYYDKREDLAGSIEQYLHAKGKDTESVVAQDLADIDEFHIGGHPATLSVGAWMQLHANARVLDIGSGLGGPARTLAEAYGCHVTGVDLTPAFCEAATIISGWLGLGDRVAFQQGDATDLPFSDNVFDAAMTIHVAMNIPDKDKVYAEARRVLKPGARFVVYDILQGSGGELLLPVPWARSQEISHLATRDQMHTLLDDAAFTIIEAEDSTDRAIAFFEARAGQMEQSAMALAPFHPFLGDDFREMAVNMVRNLTENRIRVCTFVCE